MFSGTLFDTLVLDGRRVRPNRIELFNSLDAHLIPKLAEPHCDIIAQPVC